MKNKASIITILLAAFIFSLSTITHALAAPGDLDQSFGSGGKVVIPANTIPSLVRVQADGRIITIGAYPYGGTAYISRSNADGTADTSFGAGGLVLINLDEVPEIFNDFVTLPDGKYLIAGTKDNRNALFRYNSNGTRDLSFGTNGVLTNSLSGDTISIQPDGRVIVGGYNVINGIGTGFLVRYNPAGTLDAGFGDNGIVLSEDGPDKIVLQPDGKLLVRSINASDIWQITRYNANGTRDNNFGTNGVVNSGHYVAGIGFQSNGKIILGGSVNQTYSLLERYNENGTLDATFGTNGLVRITDSSNNPYSLGIVRSLAVQRNNKIVTAGSVNGIFAVYRFDSNGSLDPTFGTNGLVTTPMSPICRFFDITLQRDGRIVAVGDTGDTIQYVGLVRYLGDNVIQATNVEELYSAINNPGNAGMPIVISPGVYMLSVNAPGGTARPNGGRLELQQDMSLLGIEGDRGAVVIDAINLPTSSFNNAPPIPSVAAIRIGKGTNAIEWLTVRNTVNGNANIGTDLTSTTANIRVAHVASTNSQRGLDIRNFGTAQTGRVINAEIVDNDFYNNRLGLQGEGFRIASQQGANGATINATLTGNRSYNNYTGLLVENNRANNAAATVFSTNDRFYDNGDGAVVGGGLSSNATVANGNTVSFTANGAVFENNNGFNNFDFGGLIVPGGENTSIPNGTSNNTVNVDLQSCRFANNQLHDLAAFGARSAPASVGLPGSNNRVNLKLLGTSVPILEVAESVPDYPGGQNVVTLVRGVAGVSGRVLTPDGNGLRNASVTLTDSQGGRRTSTTSSFGFYSFENVDIGLPYTISVSSRRYRYAPRTLQIEGSLTDVDFVGLE